MMITYPCYDDDPVYEDDQCTVNKILCDPRIRPVSNCLWLDMYIIYSNMHVVASHQFSLL